MTTATASDVDIETVADLMERLGSIPATRIRFRPYIGTATEQDLLAVDRTGKRLCELVDGVLVEKAMGYFESILAVVLASLLREHALRHDLGVVIGEAGPIGLEEGLVRMPDVSFTSWDHFPDRRLPAGQILRVAPDLAVEILSPGNTPAEMARKRREYFAAGTRLVWQLDPKSKSCAVYARADSPDEFETVAEDQSLDGGEVLPGFSLVIRDWFIQAGPRQD